MKPFLKKHLGLIIFMILVLLFPVSLSNQAKLNMKVIVTGLAIDKVDDDYEVTAQIIKNTPGTESPGISATMEFITSKAPTIAMALANLSYRSGKVTAYSHTNFIILGDSMKEDSTSCLDYFIRNKIIKSSAMLLFSKQSAGEEIQKTKSVELSVGLNFQKVFLFKERESDALMITVMQFLKQSKTNSGTSVASTVVFKPNELQANKTQEKPSGSEQSESQGSSGSGMDSESSGLGDSSSGGSGGGDEGSGSDSQKPSSEFFETQSPIYCFKNGKFVTELSGDTFMGYILMNNRTMTSDIVIDNIECDSLKNAKLSINIKNKSIKKSVRFEDGIPYLDLKLKIKNSEINEVLGADNNGIFTDEELDAISNAIKKKINCYISKTFQLARVYSLDVFDAYDIAKKFHYNETKKYSADEFISNLNNGNSVVVDVEISKLT